MNPQTRFAVETERQGRKILAEMGMKVRRTRHNASHDAVADGVRVEFKGAHWDPRERRYQFNLHENDADVLVLRCVNGPRTVAWFVCPFDIVRGRRVIKVTSMDPANYTGKLAAWLNAWPIVRDFIPV